MKAWTRGDLLKRYLETASVSWFRVEAQRLFSVIQPKSYSLRPEIWSFVLQTSNLLLKRGSRWFLTSSTTPWHMSGFTTALVHFHIFWLFSLIKITFLDCKLTDIHKLLALHHFRSKSGLFLIQGSQKTKKNEVPGNTTDLSTSHGRISF